MKRIFSFSTLWRNLVSLTTLFLLIEFIDEFEYGANGAALPVQKFDLMLRYAQVGLLLGLPNLITTLIEPVIMLFGDTHLRKWLIVGGGITVTIALLITASATSFGWLLVGQILRYPASGAFVTLAQAALVDLNPGRESQAMARWVLSGSLANLGGPLFLAVFFTLGLSWRAAYFFLALGTLLLTVLTVRAHFPEQSEKVPAKDIGTPIIQSRQVISSMFYGLKMALANRKLLRWIVLLQISELMLSVFPSYLALYFTEVVGFNETGASLLLSLFMGAALVSDLAVVYLLERFHGLKVIRFSAFIIGSIFPLLLLVQGPILKVGLAFAVNLFTLGWYTILKGEAYAALPDRKGAVLALNSAAGILGGMLPWLVGWIAGFYGLQTAMWLVLLAPVSLILFVPRLVRIAN